MKDLRPIAWRVSVEVGDGTVWKTTVQAIFKSEAERFAKYNYRRAFGVFTERPAHAEIKYAKDARSRERRGCAPEVKS